jgi:hypothetical protein
VDTRRDVEDQQGMVTAEYAVGTVAACSLAGICLYPILSSPWMHDLLLDLWRAVVGSW